MRDEDFEELLESIREGGAILRGEIVPARTFTIPDPDVAELRGAYGLSQSQFASLLGISVRTLQNWEQRRRRPEGPARVLLRVAARHPEAVLDVVREETKGKVLETERVRGAPAGKRGDKSTRSAVKRASRKDAVKAAKKRTRSKESSK